MSASVLYKLQVSPCRQGQKQNLKDFYFRGVHPVALYYHTLQNMPAIATKSLLLLYFSQQLWKGIDVRPVGAETCREK
jgi:hypothetical protein